MKKTFLLFLLPLLVSMACQSPQKEIVVEKIIEKKITNMDPALRHVVLFKFKDESSEEEVQKVVDAFMALKSKISEIEDLEWGTNNSPEGLDQGFTHCFFVTFKSEADRDIYLPHPEHKAFVEVLGPHLDKVLVVDYWAKRD
ncbi:Dabb family protein [Cecembia lonarensis]|uniref:Stress responsive A/B Barrel Domain protein n=1 Tax=Cecembia lonarensis (strain CCUG 58316 / KCTC 22772 / LW9) TaxID=1225176 RepID=K1KZ56_CECL9|nr:Dabb family protein [Cecembia lonarensis]EKB47746.1 Stress responsive A/B Barrel Domain protein [Cecembia lonarensis LW9]